MKGKSEEVGRRRVDEVDLRGAEPRAAARPPARRARRGARAAARGVRTRGGGAELPALHRARTAGHRQVAARRGARHTTHGPRDNGGRPLPSLRRGDHVLAAHGGRSLARGRRRSWRRRARRARACRARGERSRAGAARLRARGAQAASRSSSASRTCTGRSPPSSTSSSTWLARAAVRRSSSSSRPVPSWSSSGQLDRAAHQCGRACTRAALRGEDRGSAGQPRRRVCARFRAAESNLGRRRGEPALRRADGRHGRAERLGRAADPRLSAGPPGRAPRPADRQERETVERAAVIGRDFPVSALVGLADDEQRASLTGTLALARPQGPDPPGTAGRSRRGQVQLPARSPARRGVRRHAEGTARRASRAAGRQLRGHRGRRPDRLPPRARVLRAGRDRAGRSIRRRARAASRAAARRSGEAGGGSRGHPRGPEPARTRCPPSHGRARRRASGQAAARNWQPDAERRAVRRGRRGARRGRGARRERGRAAPLAPHPGRARLP